jgi:hypothetical protein
MPPVRIVIRTFRAYGKSQIAHNHLATTVCVSFCMHNGMSRLCISMSMAMLCLVYALTRNGFRYHDETLQLSLNPVRSTSIYIHDTFVHTYVHSYIHTTDTMNPSAAGVLVRSLITVCRLVREHPRENLSANAGQAYTANSSTRLRR